MIFNLIKCNWIGYQVVEIEELRGNARLKARVGKLWVIEDLIRKKIRRVRTWQ